MKHLLTGFVIAASLMVPARAADEPPAWARDAVETLQREGLLEGYPGGHLDGYRAMTRYELSELVNRVQQRDQQQHANYATRQDLQELRQSAEAVRDQMDQLDGSSLERQVDELQQRVDEMGRPGL